MHINSTSGEENHLSLEKKPQNKTNTFTQIEIQCKTIGNSLTNLVTQSKVSQWPYPISWCWNHQNLTCHHVTDQQPHRPYEGNSPIQHSPPRPTEQTPTPLNLRAILMLHSWSSPTTRNPGSSALERMTPNKRLSLINLIGPWKGIICSNDSVWSRISWHWFGVPILPTKHFGKPSKPNPPYDIKQLSVCLWHSPSSFPFPQMCSVNATPKPSLLWKCLC